MEDHLGKHPSCSFKESSSPAPASGTHAWCGLPLKLHGEVSSWLGQGGADVSSLLFLPMPLEESNLGERRLGVTPSLLSCDFLGSIS